MSTEEEILKKLLERYAKIVELQRQLSIDHSTIKVIDPETIRWIAKATTTHMQEQYFVPEINLIVICVGDVFLYQERFKYLPQISEWIQENLKGEE